MSRRGFKKKLKLWLGPQLLSWSLRWIGQTGSTVWLGREALDPLATSNKPWIYCFWHCNVTQAAWALRDKGLAGLVSASDDGEMAMRTIEALGNSTIRGSSSKGGAKALLQMIRWIKSGKIAAITPDGPRGPALKFQQGAIALASKSGAPLVPLHMESSQQWVFEKSWDLHRIPKPFSLKVISLGEPIYIPASLNDEKLEEWRLAVEKQMIENQGKALQKIQELAKDTGAHD